MSKQAAVLGSPVLLEKLEDRLLLSTGLVLDAAAARGTIGGVTVDYVAYPLDAHGGNPWSQWGKGIVAANGKVYTSIGDHGPKATLGIDGNAYVYEYDPETGAIRCVFDVQSSIAGYQPGDYGWGKIHGRLSEGADGNIYFGTYWGTTGADPDFLGGHIFKLNPYTGVSTDMGMIDDGTGYTQYGFPSTNMWSDGMVWYAEAMDKQSYSGGNYDVYFLAYDLLGREVKLLGSHPSSYGRGFFVDAQGNAYFNNGANGLTQYDASLNAITTTYSGMPGSQVRQVTEQAPNGLLYGTLIDTLKLFSFDPATGAFQTLGSLPSDTAAMELDPTGQYIYYAPGSHGDSGNGTLYQYSIATGATRAIVDMRTFLEGNLGTDLGGSYDLMVSPDGRVVYYGVNMGPVSGGFDKPAFVAIHIPNDGQTVFKTYPVSAPTSIEFTDVAGPTGVADLFRQYSHGAAWGDVNGDGYPDIFLGAFANGMNRLLINHNGTSFTESVQASINVSGMRSSGAVFADFDNDGDQDLLVIDNKGPVGNRLYANDGSGNFTDVTGASNLNFGTAFAGRNPMPLDYDGDGLLDVFIQEDPFGGTGRSRLMRNTGNLVFQDVTTAAGIGSIIGLGGSVGDLNGDTWPDLMTVYANGGSFYHHLFINNKDGTFRSISTSVFTTSWPSMPQDDWIVGAYFGDLDNDGDMDVVLGQHWESALKGGFRVSIRVYRNDGNDGSGNPTFTDVTAASGIVGVYVKQPHVEIQDFDNDGFMDILTSATIAVAGVQTPVIFRNTMGSTGLLGFALPAGMDPATYTGYTGGAWTNPRYFPGTPTADFNRDGKLDILGEEVFPSPTVSTPLFQNVGATEGFLDVTIDLGPGNANRQGIGAKVMIYEAGKVGVAGALLGSALIELGNGYVSGTMPIAHFGLPTYTQYAAGSQARATGGWAAARAFVDVIVIMPNDGGIFVSTVPTNRLIVMPGGGGINQRPQASFTADTSAAVAGDLLVNFNATASQDYDGVIVSYQWSFGDSTTADEPVLSHTYAGPGTYAVTLTVVDNKGDSGMYVVNVVLETPAVTTQPVNRTIQEGQWATFSIAAAGTAPLSYQWQRNTGGGWTSIAGATATSYTTPTAGLADNAGQFRCVVSNRLGVQASNVATLTVNAATAVNIIAQPASASVTTGRKARFDVQLTGSWPFQYQWQENTGSGWADVSGASGESTVDGGNLTFWSPLAAVSGTQYRVRVTNIAGTVTSAPATLTVSAPQVITETWTGANGSPWPSVWSWDSSDTGLTKDIQGGAGHLGAPSGANQTAYYNAINFVDGTVQASLRGNSNGPKMGLKARRADGDSDTYYSFETGRMGGYTDSNKVYLRKYVDGQATLLATATLPSNLGYNFYCMKFYVLTNGSSTDLKSKIWLATDPEPTNWTLETADGTVRLQNVSGRAGIWLNPSSNRHMYADNFSATIYLGSVNQSPVAAFTAVPATGEEPLNVQFSAASSNDPVGRIVSYGWDFGDAQTGSGRNVSHVFQLDNPAVAQNYTVLLTVTDEDGATGQYSMGVGVAPMTDHVAPKVVSHVINSGSANRSFLRTIVLGFDEAVNVAKGDLTLYNHSTGSYVDLTAAVFGSQADAASWDLSAVPLGAGRYTATLSAAGVADLNDNALDGNGDGTAGDDYVLQFHLLPGDANGDAAVDVGDLGILATGYGQVGNWWQLPPDFNGDGMVDVGDLGILATHYGEELPTYPAAATALEATAVSASRIDLGWTDASSDETGFRIERYTPTTGWQTVGTAAANAVAYADLGLPAGSAFSYRVTAFSDGGYSRMSNAAFAITEAGGGGGGAMMPASQDAGLAIPPANETPAASVGEGEAQEALPASAPLADLPLLWSPIEQPVADTTTAISDPAEPIAAVDDLVDLLAIAPVELLNV